MERGEGRMRRWRDSKVGGFRGLVERVWLFECESGGAAGHGLLWKTVWFADRDVVWLVCLAYSFSRIGNDKREYLQTVGPARRMTGWRLEQ